MLFGQLFGSLTGQFAFVVFYLFDCVLFCVCVFSFGLPFGIAYRDGLFIFDQIGEGAFGFFVDLAEFDCSLHFLDS